MKPNLNSLLSTCGTFGLALGLALSSPLLAAEVRIKQRLPVSPVWAGHPVGFALLTDAPANRQYAAYYDADRNMVVVSRALDAGVWTKKILPSKIGWDSHNYITLALDRDGQLHVVGNLHVTPLIYFRTTAAGDITTLAAIPRMTGDREQRMTYPRFIEDTDGSLIFTYRDGSSGNGSNLYNRYDEKTKSWSRLLDLPLFEGRRPAGMPRPPHDTDDMMNAYADGPKRGPDGFWHLSWVWRDTPAAETNHDLGYARSRDLRHWETVDGRPVTLPISLQTPGVILDPVPANGGIINGSGKLGFDDKGRVIVAYHKFDDKGATQLYLARAENGAWKIRQVTQWTYRWEPRGGGSIPFDIRHSGVQHDPALGLYISIHNARHGSGVLKVDPDTLKLGEKIPAAQVPGRLPPELGHGVRAPLGLRTAADTGTAPAGLRYVLRWETLPVNRDRPREGPPPEPSALELIVLETAASATPAR
ncbi:hypothetical protein OPIT5_12240 [Opitutaceae bacterium TAV5]|nr:hypothetical protein OPIT5_12240 [Opitutaceae bacterium TAV5]